MNSRRPGSPGRRFFFVRAEEIAARVVATHALPPPRAPAHAGAQGYKRRAPDFGFLRAQEHVACLNDISAKQVRHPPFGKGCDLYSCGTDCCRSGLSNSCSCAHKSPGLRAPRYWLWVPACAGTRWLDRHPDKLAAHTSYLLVLLRRQEPRVTGAALLALGSCVRRNT